MNRWVCTKCGETATSKCVSQRTVFPSDEGAAVMSHVYGYEVKVGPQGEYIDGQCLATVTLSYSILASRKESEAMREWPDEYVAKPYAPHCDLGPKPRDPGRLMTWPKFSRENRTDDYDIYRGYKRAWKEAKAAYQREIAEWERRKLEHEVAMCEYEERFRAWLQYEEAKEHVWEHNAEARRRRKEYFKAHVDSLLSISRDSMAHWLCGHDWVLAKDEPTNRCSLGCEHRKDGDA